MSRGLNTSIVRLEKRATAGRPYTFSAGARGIEPNRSAISAAKIFFKPRDHEIGQAFVVTFDVTVVGELRHHDQTQGVGKRRKFFERVNFAAKFEALFSAFDPMTLVVLADDVEQFFAAQTVQIRFIGDEQFLVGQPGKFFDVGQQHVVGAVLDVL